MDTLIDFVGLTAVIIILFVVGAILTAAKIGQRAPYEVIHARETNRDS